MRTLKDLDKMSARSSGIMQDNTNYASFQCFSMQVGILPRFLRIVVGKTSGYKESSTAEIWGTILFGSQGLSARLL